MEAGDHVSWARLDDRYDDNRKIRRCFRSHPYAVAVHVMAITHSSRHETDGLVENDWLEELLPKPPVRARVVALLVEEDLLKPLAAGETYAIEDSEGNEITLGPCREIAYFVNDYLAFNPSSVQLASRRSRDRVRKASARNPDGHDTDSERTPRARTRAPAGAGPGRGTTTSSEEQGLHAGVRIRGRAVVPEHWDLACRCLAEFNAQTGKKLGALDGKREPTENAKRIYERIRAFPELTFEQHREIIRRTLASKWWWKGQESGDPPSVGVIYGPRVFEDNIDRQPGRAGGRRQPTGADMEAALND